MVRAEQRQPLLEPATQLELGLAEKPEREVGAPHRRAQPGLHERLRGELVVEARRRGIEDLAHRHVRAAHAGVDRGQHLLQEVHGRLRLVPRGVGLVTRGESGVALT
jgi:hypothetical protein